LRRKGEIIMRPLPPFKARPVSTKQIARTPPSTAYALAASTEILVKATRRPIRAGLQVQPVQPKVLRTN
jgi:hypothetical protein